MEENIISKEEAARQWLQIKFPKYNRYQLAELMDAFHDWCANYEDTFYESEYEEIWLSELENDTERRKRDGSWYTDQEQEYGQIYPYTWDDIDHLKFPENQWRIQGLLPLEGFVILAGVSGEGKSFVSLEMANALTTPRNFLDEPSFSVVGTNVLYIDAEMSKSELQRRGRQLGFSKKRKHKLLFVSRDDLDLKNKIKKENL